MDYLTPMEVPILEGAYFPPGDTVDLVKAVVTCAALEQALAPEVADSHVMKAVAVADFDSYCFTSFFQTLHSIR